MNVACVMAGAASMYAYNRYRGPTCAKCRAPQPPSSRQTGGLLALEVGVLTLYAYSLSAKSLLLRKKWRARARKNSTF